MTIETKYNLEQEVYFLSDGKIKSSKVLVISWNSSDKRIWYTIYLQEKEFEEKMLFPSKEALIESLK